MQYTKGGADMKRGVVLKHFPDKNQTLLVDKKSRRRRCLWLVGQLLNLSADSNQMEVYFVCQHY